MKDLPLGGSTTCRRESLELIVFVVYLRTVHEDAARQLKLKPRSCGGFLMEKEPSQSEQEKSSSTDDDAYEPLDATQESLNTSSSLLGCSPLKPDSQ